MILQYNDIKYCNLFDAIIVLLVMKINFDCSERQPCKCILPNFENNSPIFSVKLNFKLIYVQFHKEVIIFIYRFSTKYTDFVL